MGDTIGKRMNALGFVDGGGGDWCVAGEHPRGVGVWVWYAVSPGESGQASWLGVYPCGTWVADPKLTTEDLAAGRGVAFSDPVTAAVWLRTEHPEWFA